MKSLALAAPRGSTFEPKKSRKLYFDVIALLFCFQSPFERASPRGRGGSPLSLSSRPQRPRPLAGAVAADLQVAAAASLPLATATGWRPPLYARFLPRGVCDDVDVDDDDDNDDALRLRALAEQLRRRNEFTSMTLRIGSYARVAKISRVDGIGDASRIAK